MVRKSMERECCGNGAYRIVFMDINMPIMDGYAATTEIRKMLPKEETMVVAATAYPEKAVEERGDAAGMDDFLSKPLDPKKVAAILEKVGLKKEHEKG